MECLNHPDRGRMAQRSGVERQARSTLPAEERASWPLSCRPFPFRPPSRRPRRRPMPSWGRSPSPQTTTGTTISTRGADHLGHRTDAAELPSAATSCGSWPVPAASSATGSTPSLAAAAAIASAINRPGVIYRVDPATGKASVFFDLNTVMNQLDPNSLSTDGKNPAANSLGASTGLRQLVRHRVRLRGLLQRQPDDVRQLASIAPTPPRTPST